MQRLRYFALATWIVAVGASFFVAGYKGALGMIAGIAGALINLAGWWYLIRSSSASVESMKARRFGTASIVLLFFVKLPLFVALAFAISKLGRTPLSCFLIGVGLVYSALVGWSFVPRRDHP